jgi:hypothetical protein
MQAPQSLRPTEDAAFTAIEDLRDSLKPVVDQCRKEYGWSDDVAKIAVDLYMSHLRLCYKYADRFIAALDRNADVLWHHHIVDTIRYRDDCNRIFGTFLNHVPFYGDPTKEEDESFDQTIQLYEKEFGKRPPDPYKTSVAPPA